VRVVNTCGSGSPEIVAGEVSSGIWLVVSLVGEVVSELLQPVSQTATSSKKIMSAVDLLVFRFFCIRMVNHKPVRNTWQAKH
jgi:hypothetical protein